MRWEEFHRKCDPSSSVVSQASLRFGNKPDRDCNLLMNSQIITLVMQPSSRFVIEYCWKQHQGVQ